MDIITTLNVCMWVPVSVGVFLLFFWESDEKNYIFSLNTIFFLMQGAKIHRA